LFHMIANEIMWFRRKVNKLKLVARTLSNGTVCKIAVLILRRVLPPLSQMPPFNVTFIKLY